MLSQSIPLLSTTSQNVLFFLNAFLFFFHFPVWFFFSSISEIVTFTSSLSISEGVGLMSESHLPDIQSSEKKHF